MTSVSLKFLLMAYWSIPSVDLICSIIGCTSGSAEITENIIGDLCSSVLLSVTYRDQYPVVVLVSCPCYRSYMHQLADYLSLFQEGSGFYFCVRPVMTIWWTWSIKSIVDSMLLHLDVLARTPAPCTALTLIQVQSDQTPKQADKRI